MDERRKSYRRRTLKSGKVILSDWTVMNCVIRDLSEAGAGSNSAPWYSSRRSSVSSSARPLVKMRVALDWQRGLIAGVRFIGPDEGPGEAQGLAWNNSPGHGFLLRNRRRRRCREIFVFRARRSPRNSTSATTPTSPGFDQPYTSDDVGAIVSAADATVEERCEVLRRMLDDLENRQDMDRTQEFAPLIDEVRAALAALSEPADGIGPPGAFAYDPEDRALAPDEILEREEEEEARRKAEGD